jgi:anti-sigma factor RsiW
MRCPIETQESADQLLAYTARRLEPEAAAVFERHMESCAACRQFAQAQQAVWSALDAWEAMPVSVDFNRRLYRRIEEQGSWWQRLTRPLRPVLVRQGLPAAAAACLLVTAGILIERPGSTPSESQSAQIEAVQAVQADQVEDALEDMELLREFHSTVRADASRTL